MLKKLLGLATMAAAALTFPLSASAGQLGLDRDEIAQLASMGTVEHEKFMLGAHSGTLGHGVHLGYRISERVALRYQFSAFDYDEDDIEISGEEFDAAFDIKSGGIFVDYSTGLRPLGGDLQLSLGALKMDHKASLSTSYTGTFNYGGSNFVTTNTDIAGQVEYNKIAPVLLVGYKKQLLKHVALDLDFGAVYQGTPDVTFTTSGDLSGDATFQNAVERERQDIYDEISDYKFYPVIQAGITISF